MECKNACKNLLRHRGNNVQSLCHNDMDVQPNFRELVTSSRHQSTASRIVKLQLLNSFITPSRISVGDKHSEAIFISESLMPKMA